MLTATPAVHAGEAATVTPILAPTVTAVTILPTLPATVETPTDSPTAAPAVLLANARPIVFDSTQDVDYAEIYIMNSDGSYEQRLTFNTVQDDEADLSPDGQWIAFDRGANNTESIWLMRSDGSEARSVVNGRCPDWSPDGRYLAYETWGDASHIWILDVTRGTTWQLTNGSRPYRAPDWSPDGEEMVVMARYGSDWQIVIITVATGAERPITSGSGDKRFPTWSPDGSLIAYNTLTGDWPDDIWLIEPSGAGARAITGSGNNGRPTWSPDGQFLVFNSYVNSQWVLYQVDRNGRQGKQLTTGGHDQRASWSN